MLVIFQSCPLIFNTYKTFKGTVFHTLYSGGFFLFISENFVIVIIDFTRDKGTFLIHLSEEEPHV